MRGVCTGTTRVSALLVLTMCSHIHLCVCVRAEARVYSFLTSADTGQMVYCAFVTVSLTCPLRCLSRQVHRQMLCIGFCDGTDNDEPKWR